MSTHSPSSQTTSSSSKKWKWTTATTLKLSVGLAAAGGLAWLSWSYLKRDPQSETSAEIDAAMAIATANGGPNGKPLPGPEPSDPELGNLAEMAAAGSLHEYMQSLIAKYGKVGAFWWGKTRVAYISSPRALAQMHLASLHYKPPLFLAPLKPLIGEYSLQYANGSDYWKRHHKIMRRAFGTKAVWRYASLINDAFNDAFLKGHLSAAKAVTIETDEKSESASSDSRRSGPLLQIRAYSSLLRVVSTLLIRIVIGPYIAVSQAMVDRIADAQFKCWDTIEARMVRGVQKDEAEFERDLADLREGLQEILDSARKTESESRARVRVVAHRRGDKHNTDDAFESAHNDDWSLIETMLFEKDASIYEGDDSRRLSDIIGILSGGIHTTVNALAWTLYHLACNQKVQENAREEVAKVIGTGDAVDGSSTVDTNNIDSADAVAVDVKVDDASDGAKSSRRITVDRKQVSALKYVRCVAQESLRHSALKPWTARASMDEDLVISAENGEDFRIVAKMPVIISLAAMFEDKSVWGQTVADFDPQRFVCASKAKRALQPFGGCGKRVCPGNHLFYAQFGIFVAQILSRYRITLADSTDESAVRKSFGLVTAMSKDVLLNLESV